MRYRLSWPNWWPWKDTDNQDADVLVVLPWRVAYARVPKAANSSIKAAIAKALQLPPIDGLPVTRDRYWEEVQKGAAKGVVELVSTRRFAQDPRYSDYYCFSVVRNPVSRIVSCYKNKIVRNRRLSRQMLKRGYRLGMSFESFVRRACAEGDENCDIHMRSQYTMTCYNDQPLAQAIVDLDDLGRRWEEITSAIRKKAGVDLGPLRVANSTAKVRADVEVTSELESLIRKRYAKDYTILFPDL